MVCSTVLLSSSNNFTWITSQCGCMPSLIIEGAPGTGKTTMSSCITALYGCSAESCILVLNDSTASAMSDLNNKVNGCVIWCVIFYITFLIKI